MIPEGWPLDYWKSKEWLDVQDKLDNLERDSIVYNPGRTDLFRALDLCRLDRCRVAVFGQDPYPNPHHATGVAFSSEKSLRLSQSTGSLPIEGSKRRSIPGSLRVLLREYCRDLSLGYPNSGCLEQWCDRGVLLWNVTPTIEIDRDERGKWVSYTHKFWPEWPPLTQEIIERLSAKGGIVFVFLGSRAREYSKYVDNGAGYNTQLFYSHPSPMAQRWTNNPILGSRLFTTINIKLLNVHCKEPIDWRLE